MPNIRVDVGFKIKDGSEIKFRSPVDCSAVTGLIVYYPMEDGSVVSKEFAFADAHGNNVGNISHLFAENVVVKVILDVTTGMAFVQNADTNAYLEAQLASKRPNTWTPTADEVGARPNTWLPTIAEIGAAPAGYGLGVSDAPFHLTVDSTAFDNFLNIGWYAIQTTFKISDKTFYFVMLRVTSFGSGCIMQEVIPVDTDYMLRRYCWHGAWTEWDWDCPPMTVGAEYRTTERYNGKAVYVRAIETGELPNNHFKQFITGINYANIVDFYMLIRNADTQYVYKITYDASTFWYEGTYFVYFPKSDMSQWSGTVFYKYTKD